MTKRQYRQYEMLVRVCNFGDEHKEKFPGGTAGAVAFEGIAAAIAEIDEFVDAKLTARRLSMKEKLAAKLALSTRIGAIARSARVMAKTVAGADAKFPRPTRRSDVAVLQSGRLFLNEVEPVKDAFIRCGLAPTFVEELQQSIARLEQAISGRSAGKTSAVVAQKGIRSTIKQAVDVVRSLDVLIANTLGHDAHVMNAWKSTRHVEVAGKNASVGAPSEDGVSMPVFDGEDPIPPAGTPAQPSSDQPSDAAASDAPQLRRAS